MTDTRLLFNLLTEYRSSVERHLSQLREEYQQLETQWHMFAAEYHGDGADQFKEGWSRTASRFNEYIDRSVQIARFLDERIERLRQVNEQEGSLSV